MALIAAGYIIHDDTLIFAIGSTEAEAIQDLGSYNQGLHPEDAVDPAIAQIDQATADLLSKVIEVGGNVAWCSVDGVCCTTDEYDRG